MRTIPEGAVMRVSAVIPCYNRAHMVGQAIESVLRQTRPADEIIVVDDGSTDRSAEVAESFGARVRVIRRPHSGIPVTRNAGIQAATGDLVAWLDSDDVWEPEKLALQLPLFEDPAVGAAYGRASWSLTGRPQPEGELADGDIFEAIFRDFGLNCSTFVARRDVLLDIGGFDESIAVLEDFDLLLKLTLRWKVRAVSKLIARSTVHSGQITKSDDARLFVHRLRLKQKYASEYESRTGTSGAQWRADLLARALMELELLYYLHRDLRAARLLSQEVEELFPELDDRTRARVRRIRRRSFLPKVLFRVVDTLSDKRRRQPRVESR